MAGLILATSGCVQRRLTIRSNPPGALVFVDNVEIGTTPVSTDFIYYGTRRIELIKDGYETLRVEQPLRAPWYQYFPLDFVTENLLPFEIRDERTLQFTLVPQQMVSTNQLLARADDLRRANRGPGLPPSSLAAPMVGPAAPQATPVFVPQPQPQPLPAPGVWPPGVLPPSAGGGAMPAMPPTSGAYFGPGTIPSPAPIGGGTYAPPESNPLAGYGSMAPSDGWVSSNRAAEAAGASDAVAPTWPPAGDPSTPPGSVGPGYGGSGY